MGNVRASVAEPVGRAGGDADGVAGMGQDAAAAKAAQTETHLPLYHCKALFLHGMDVTGGHMRAGRQIEVEGEYPPTGLCAALPDDDMLAADRIDDDAPGRRTRPCVDLADRCDRSILTVQCIE